MSRCLKCSIENCKNLDPSCLSITARYTPAHAYLLTRKVVYPYEYMDSLERFTDPLSLWEAFHSKLREENISEEDYTHAQKVWTAFGCKDMGDHHDLCLRTDMLFLSDIFETFRKTCKWQ